MVSTMFVNVESQYPELLAEFARLYEQRGPEFSVLVQKAEKALGELKTDFEKWVLTERYQEKLFQLIETKFRETVYAESSVKNAELSQEDTMKYLGGITIGKAPGCCHIVAVWLDSPNTIANIVIYCWQ